MRVPSSSSNKVSGQGLPPVSLLILGAGWTSTFLIPLLDKENIIYAATSTTGRERTIPFNFDPDSDDATPYLILPPAQTILITFPLKGTGQSKSLHSLYQQTHPGFAPNYLQLGSTGIWQIENQPVWIDRHTSYDKSNVRAVAEDELMSLGGAVLNLAGLWGGKRQPRDWVSRVAANKEQLKGKGSLHLVHGEDVAKAIMALHKNFTPGERWMLTDMFVYDWWSLAISWGSGGSDSEDQTVKGEHPTWVRELMTEYGVRALPRSMETLGRCYDTREFWQRFDIAPARARI